jgi:Anti-sigma-28 factor, FlgM
MHRHGPKYLEGPVSRKRLRWLAVFAEECQDDATAAQGNAGERRAEEPTDRKDLIERVRQEIAQGTYDTPEKWEKALDRLLDDLERD